MTFRNYLLEGLAYIVKNDTFEKILKDNDYIRMSKGTNIEKIKSFGNGKELLFTYESGNNKLVVKKQGWQLMNIKRGY